MSDLVIDYLEEVKKVISENYEPADLVSKEFEMSTSDLVDNLRNIIPHKAVDDYVVYQALKQLQFEPKEKPEKPLAFFWYFKRKS